MEVNGRSKAWIPTIPAPRVIMGRQLKGGRRFRFKLSTGIGFVLVGEGHEHLQIEYIQLDPRNKGREGQVGGE